MRPFSNSFLLSTITISTTAQDDLPRPDGDQLRFAFERSSVADWSLNPGWEAQDGVITASNTDLDAHYDRDIFSNGYIEADVWVEDGNAEFRLRATEAQNYTARLASTGAVELYRNGNRIASDVMADFDPAAWYKIRFNAEGDTLNVSVNGENVLVYTDSAPLGEGIAALGSPGLAQNESTPPRVAFDNVQVNAVDAASPTNNGQMVSTIGDRAWMDLDFDGIQDIGEPGMAGITLYLFAEANGTYPYLGSQTTNANGEYSFTVPGGDNYLLYLEVPRGFLLTLPEATFDEDIDSDFDPVTGATDFFFVDTNSTDDSLDVGFLEITACQSSATLDISLVMDGSGSISSRDFALMQNFAIGLVDSFQVGPQQTRFNVTQFSSTGRTRYETRLTGNRAGIISAIRGMDQINGSTDIGEGLYGGYYDLFVLGRNRTVIPNVIILLTDGQHNGRTDPIFISDAAKNDNILIYTVGIGGYDLSEIQAIASDPDERFVFTANTFVQLVQSLQSIAESTCNTPIRPYLPPPLVSPVDGEFFTDVPDLSWQSVPYTEERYEGFFDVAIYEENGSTTPVYTGRTTELTISPQVTLPEGRYLWIARGGNAVGVGPYNGVPGEFVVSTLIPATGMTSPTITQAPVFPVLTWDNMQTAEWYNIIMVSDADNDVIFDEWQQPTDLNCTTTCTFEADIELIANGDYSWYVRGYNGTVGIGPWSTGATQTVNIAPPGLIVRVAPAANAVVTSGEVEFQWERETTAQWYNVRVEDADGEKVTDEWYNVANVCGPVTCTAPVIEYDFGLYRWQMRAWSPGGLGDYNANLLTFRAGPPPPGVVTRTQPANNTVIESGDVEFGWNAVTNAQWYNVIVLDADDEIVLDDWYQGSTVCAAGACTAPVESFEFGEYEWYMGAWGPGGLGQYTTNPFNFRAGPVPPGATTQITPVTTDPAGVTFQWEENPDAEWYNVVILDDQASVVSNEWYQGSTVCSAGTCTATDVNDLENGSYVWWMGSWNPGGLGEYTNLSFTVNN